MRDRPPLARKRVVGVVLTAILAPALSSAQVVMVVGTPHLTGSAHRPFTEEELRSQPWLEVVPAVELLTEEGPENR